MNTSESNSKLAGISARVEYFARRLFERIGAAIDFALRRGSGLEGGPRTDLAALVAAVEQAIEDNLRQEGSPVVAPNLIELRYDYETWTRMGSARREFLQKELGSSIYEYIYNRRYATIADVQVRIAYDAFTRGLEVRTDFGEKLQVVMPQNEPEVATVSGPASRSCNLALRIAAGSRTLRATVTSGADPAGIGRNSGNALIIDDSTVSNFHAAFMITPEGNVALADRGSSNGTCVNGVLLETGGRSIVRNGDRLKFGDVEATLEITETT
jgi:hypothetical protein